MLEKMPNVTCVRCFLYSWLLAVVHVPAVLQKSTRQRPVRHWPDRGAGQLDAELQRWRLRRPRRQVAVGGDRAGPPGKRLVLRLLDGTDAVGCTESAVSRSWGTRATLKENIVPTQRAVIDQDGFTVASRRVQGRLTDAHA